MSINQFFTNTIGASLRNARWSWGAVDPMNNRVYLRVWEDEIQDSNGQKTVFIASPTKGARSNGFHERNKHLSLLQQGAEGFAVICKAADPQASPREIESFNRDYLARLGAVSQVGEDYFAQIVSEVPVAQLADRQTAYSTLPDYIKILNQSTETDALINARVGQGQFRVRVLQQWDNRCAVTGLSLLAAIRASHIKPWRDSDNGERLDPHNGLPLAAHLDALFDAGLITFRMSGEMLVSESLPAEDIQILGLQRRSLSTPPPSESRSYLEFHNTQVFRPK